MKVDGACHCGNIRYEAEVDPAKVIICHRTDCQSLSGTAFRTVAQTEPGTFRLLSGAPKVDVKTGDSKNQREQTFCPNCGSPIYSAPVGPQPKARRPARRHASPAGSTCPARSVLVSLLAGLAAGAARHEAARQTAGVQRTGKLHGILDAVA